jgi:lipopolysaccharide transport system ATP-binding protein
MAHILARDIVVEFPIYNMSHRSLKKAVLHATTGGRLARDTGNRVVVRALDRASFDIREGDRVGLHGHNGAGKTTLLRVLSGIYEPVSGELGVRGRVATLLDLSLGIDPESTGYENIMLRGILAGLRPAEIRSKLDEIAEFTELAEYLDMPVRTYSSGMQLRLAFAVSTSVHADILLMDEWLSVGDAAFAAKAQERLHSLVSRSPILVLASHSLELLTTVCTRVFSMEHGVVAERSIEELRRQVADKQMSRMGTSQIAAATHV